MKKIAIFFFLNPFYYRSYTMDRETDYYYLYSRYYIPEWGRFLNSDIYVDTGTSILGTSILGTNMFAYCDNNPVNSIDPFGYWTKADHYDLTKDYVNSHCTNSIIKKDQIMSLLVVEQLMKTIRLQD